MAYQSLYRKYRPQTFADVVGQGHVTRTLQNALASGRVAHGYLFTGTRGTAKTTVARLLAKALNCQSSNAPTPEPCNRCDACIRITNGSCIDVIEMDAASHRGVADIEEVRKSVGYGPMEMRYKVFIIDEAHQLSSDAKDAFLKTLEEPPDNVVFVLATTEPQAIPITIRSRCQQFDFKRGSLNDITSRLRYVLDCEGVTYAPEAVSLVARGAEGSYRDSLSLLEQVLAFSPKHISAADVDTVLGTLDAEALAQVTQAVARKDAPTAFALAGQLLDSGKEARTLLRTLSAHFRDLLLVTVGGPAVASELTPEEVQRLQQEQQACRFSPQMMLRAMDILNEAQGETRWNNQHRLLVELTFLKLMTLDGASGPPAATPIPHAQFATAPIVFSPQSTPPQSAAPPPAPPPAPTPVREPEPPAPVEEAARPAETPTHEQEPEPEPETRELPAGFFADDRADDEDEEEFGEDTQTPSLFGEDEDAEEKPEAPAPLPVSASAPSPPVSLLTVEAESEPEPEADDGEEDIRQFLPEPAFEPADEDAPPSFFDTSDLDEALPTEIRPKETAVAAEETTEPEPEEDSGIDLDLQQVQRIWPRFLQEAQKISKQTEVMMAKAFPMEAHGKTVVLGFSARMNYDRMNEPKKLEFVRKLLARCLDVNSVTVRFVLGEDVAPPPPRARGEKKAIKRDPIAELEALTSLQTPTPPPIEDGFGNWGGFASPPPPAPMPAPRPAETPPVSMNINTGAPPPATAPRNGHGNGYSAAADDNGFSARRAVALEIPLVQETLQIFGGDIIED